MVVTISFCYQNIDMQYKSICYKFVAKALTNATYFT